MARAEPPIPLVMRPRLNGGLPRPAGLEAACAETGRSRGEIVRDALRRQLQLMRFERLRRQALPHGEVPAGSRMTMCFRQSPEPCAQ